MRFPDRFDTDLVTSHMIIAVIVAKDQYSWAKHTAAGWAAGKWSPIIHLLKRTLNSQIS